MINKSMLDATALAKGHEDLKKDSASQKTRFCHWARRAIKSGTQIGTQKCAERAVEAVDAVSAVRIFLSKISAC